MKDKLTKQETLKKSESFQTLLKHFWSAGALVCPDEFKMRLLWLSMICVVHAAVTDLDGVAIEDFSKLVVSRTRIPWPSIQPYIRAKIGLTGASREIIYSPVYICLYRRLQLGIMLPVIVASK